MRNKGSIKFNRPAAARWEPLFCLERVLLWNTACFYMLRLWISILSIPVVMIYSLDEVLHAREAGEDKARSKGVIKPLSRNGQR